MTPINVIKYATSYRHYKSARRVPF